MRAAFPTWPANQYQLLDFGSGRKLERFAGVTLDRPSPAAMHAAPVQRDLWEHLDIHRVEVHESNERATTECSEANTKLEWIVEYESLRFQLHITPFGHVGLFPEHAAHWPWIDDQVKHIRASSKNSLPDEAASPKCRVLNLFAYTGAASLYAAARDCEVVHVDASAPAVQWARTNAKLSRLESAPIRWIVDDVRTFVARELRRKRQYEMILLDPPTYGHGPKGTHGRSNDTYRNC